MRRLALAIVAMALAAAAADRDRPAEVARLKDIATVEGVRDNLLAGYGVVVGLNGTGDRRQTLFTTQTLGNILQRMGLQIPTAAVQVRNVAAVFVTATLPPFAHPGTRLDVTVSSIGDATSLDGGLLLLAPLSGPDGRVYAMAQGPVTVGGYRAGLNGNLKQVNHPTVGTIPGGAIVERETSVNLQTLDRVALLLREPDFVTARHVAEAINQALGEAVAVATDSRRIEIQRIPQGLGGVPGLMARIEDLPVKIEPVARVVINERTGTVVLGGDVTLTPASIFHGNLTVEIVTRFEVSQPAPLSPGGQTVVVPQTGVQAQEQPAQTIRLQEGATVADLVRGLQAIGATPRDVIAILQALQRAGALHAELEVI
jgi:flagellar P-ring protein precursor FlgI